MRVVSGVICAGALLWSCASLGLSWDWERNCEALRPGEESTARYLDIYNGLTAREIAVEWIFKLSTQLRSQSDPNNANRIQECRVEGPRAAGPDVEPLYRRLKFQMTWSHNSLGVPYEAQHGYRFTYAMYPSRNQREPLGFEVCRRPQGCGSLKFTTPVPVKQVAYKNPVKCAMPRGPSGKTMTHVEFFRSVVSDLEKVNLPAWEERVDTGRKNEFGYSIYRIEKHPAGAVDPLNRLAERVLYKNDDEHFTYGYCFVAVPPGEDETSRELDRRFYFAKIADRGQEIDGEDFPNIYFNALRVDVHARCTGPGSSPSSNCDDKQLISYAMCESKEVCESMGISPKDLGLDPAQFAKR